MVNTEIRFDYILCSQRWRRSVQSAKTRLGANFSSDHELLIAKFRSKLKEVGKTTGPSRNDPNQIPYDYTVEVCLCSLMCCLGFLIQGWYQNQMLKWVSLSFALHVSWFVKWIDVTVPTTSQGYTENQMRCNCRWKQFLCDRNCIREPYGSYH